MCINTCALSNFVSFVRVLSSYVMSLPKVKTFVSQPQSGARRWRYIKTVDESAEYKAEIISHSFWVASSQSIYSPHPQMMPHAES